MKNLWILFEFLKDNATFALAKALACGVLKADSACMADVFNGGRRD